MTSDTDVNETAAGTTTVTTVEIPHGKKAYTPATYKQMRFLYELADTIENDPRSGYAFMKYTTRYDVSSAIAKMLKARNRGEATKVVFIR